MADVVVLKQTAIRKEEQPVEPERAVKMSVIPMVIGADPRNKDLFPGPSSPGNGQDTAKNPEAPPRKSAG